MGFLFNIKNIGGNMLKKVILSTLAFILIPSFISNFYLNTCHKYNKL